MASTHRTALNSQIPAMASAISAHAARYHDRNPLAQPRPGEIPMKQWVYEEAERCGISVRGIEKRLEQGKYPGLPIVRRPGTRMVFVRTGG